MKNNKFCKLFAATASFTNVKAILKIFNNILQSYYFYDNFVELLRILKNGVYSATKIFHKQYVTYMAFLFNSILLYCVLIGQC